MSTPDGNVCSLADQNDPDIYCLTRGQSIGLAVSSSLCNCERSCFDAHQLVLQLTAESGIISLLAVLAVFAFIVVSDLAFIL